MKQKDLMKVEAEADHEAKDEDEGDSGTHALDTLCLALGLLTNLVQVVDEAKAVVRRTRQANIHSHLWPKTNKNFFFHTRSDPCVHVQNLRVQEEVLLFKFEALHHWT